MNQEVTDALTSLHLKLDAILADPSRRRWLSVPEAAAYAAIGDDSIRGLISAGKLTGHRPVPGRVVVDRLELDALIEGSTHAPRKGRGIRR